MAVEIIMPKLGMSMVEGTVVAWKINIGEPVKQGDGIVEISSEKIEMEVESPGDGVLLEILVPAGGIVPIGTVLGYVGNPGEQVKGREEIPGTTTAKQGGAAVMEATVTEAAPNPSAAPDSSRRSPIRISPVARKMAEAADLDLTTIQGSGPQGRITKEDIEKILRERETGTVQSLSPIPDHQPSTTATAPPLPQAERVTVSGIRKVIASRMMASVQQSAQVTMTMKADVTNLQAVRKQVTAEVHTRFGIKLTLTDFIAKAVVSSLLEHKQMNSAFIDDAIERYHHVHLGIAVAVDNGLLVPVVRQAEQYSLIQLAAHIKAVQQRVAENKVTADELTGSTFSITNLGNYGVEFFTPILNPPETGILGVGVAEQIPVYLGEELHRRSLLPLSLTFDHRVLDGVPAAQFMATVKQHLEQPYSLLL